MRKGFSPRRFTTRNESWLKKVERDSFITHHCVKEFGQKYGCGVPSCAKGCIIGRDRNREIGKQKRALKRKYPHLVQGYYLFGVLRDAQLVYVGTAKGDGEDKFRILTLQKHYNGNGAVLFLDGLDKDQARYYKRKLVEQYQPCENSRKVKRHV